MDNELMTGCYELTLAPETVLVIDPLLNSTAWSQHSMAICQNASTAMVTGYCQVDLVIKFPADHRFSLRDLIKRKISEEWPKFYNFNSHYFEIPLLTFEDGGSSRDLNKILDAVADWYQNLAKIAIPDKITWTVSSLEFFMEPSFDDPASFRQYILRGLQHRLQSAHA